MKIVESLKKSPFLHKTYHMVKKHTVERPMSQKKILKEILKYHVERFKRYSGAYSESKGKDTAYITWLCHVIEKGLAMRDMRPGFGQEKIRELCNLTLRYGEKYGCNNVTYRSCEKTIREYSQVNRTLNVQFDEDILALLDRFENGTLPDIGGGCTIQTFFSQKNGTFPEFARSRHSVRDFDQKRGIKVETLIEAIELAQTAPSACNRQPVKVHIVSNPSLIKRCLALQNGNRGFGDLVDKLLIITGNLQTVLGVQEFFDLNTNVGIFIMNLCYSLHYYEIGSCVLNWYVLPDDDRKLRKIIPIADEENVVAFIACGKVPDRFRVAQSDRYDVNEIIEIH